MFTLSQRVKMARLTVGDQAEYLQQLIDQFDMPYDVCCTLQTIVDELRGTALRLKSMGRHLPRRRQPPDRRRSD